MIEEKVLTDRQIAERMTMQSFLNCYLRETGMGEMLQSRDLDTQALGLSVVRLIRCLLPRQGMELLAPLRYWSPTGRHLFQFPVYYRPEGRTNLLEIDYVTLAALLTKELKLEHGGDGKGDELLLRVIDSCRNVERFVQARREDADSLYSIESQFITTEQSLVFGHHLHPTPKSRQDMTETEVVAYSPELEGSFPLHYFRAHPTLVSEGSALNKSATDLIKAELEEDPEFDEVLKEAYCQEDGYSLIPVHPWQADFLLCKPVVRHLVERGLLKHLGSLGTAYRPTSSIRTVYRRDAAFMLKLSLNVKITNSVRPTCAKSWNGAWKCTGSCIAP